ncbi:hypothetical protein SLA2020_324310 [Shorea laevis]
MVLALDENNKRLLGIWNIRGMIILTVLNQFTLILLASLRRKTRSLLILISLWAAYVFGDWIVLSGIGLIYNEYENDEMMALWAAFLLLHSGFPDNINALNLVDNDLWRRYSVFLTTEVGLTLYLSILSLRRSKLWIPTFLVLTPGIIKAAERSTALFRASFKYYGDEVANVSLLEKKAATEPDSFLTGLMLRKELAPHGTIKNLLVGPLISSARRKFSRGAFLQKSAKDVLGMIEIELSLLYEALYTKLPVVHCKFGYFLRIISSGCILGALLSFRSFTKQSDLRKFDIWLTYILFLGAIISDFIAIGLLLFSDFSILSYYSLEENSGSKIMVWNKEYENMDKKVIKSCRWSKTISRCNLITNCFKDYPLWLKKLAPHWLEVYPNRLAVTMNMKAQNLEEDQEWHFIFEELKRKAQDAETVEMGKQICLKRGDGILHSHENYRHLIWSVRDLDYTESLLTWHTATEFCFQFEDSNPVSDNMDYRLISKVLSDYMFYLLEMRSRLMAAVFVDQKEVRKRAYLDTKEYFSQERILDEKDLSRKIFSTRPPETHVTSLIRGYERTSIILGARKLACQLREQNGFPWKLMSQVWVELLSYAAITCRAEAHAQQISGGGELLTFVWLLMNHLGLGTQFSTEQILYPGQTDQQAPDEHELAITYIRGESSED